jgi:hypothetical protein
MKRGKFHHQEALDERPQSWAGGLLKKLHRGARVRLHAFIRMRLPVPSGYGNRRAFSHKELRRSQADARCCRQ